MSSAGLFATARRGGLTMEQVREIEAHRAKDRPTPWQALAARYGRPVADIRAVMESPRPASAQTVEPPEPPQIDKRKAASDRLTSKEPMMVRLWNQGVGVQEISRTLGIGLSSVTTLRNRLNLPSRVAGNPGLEWTPEQDEVIKREYIVAGKTSTAVAAMLKVSRGALLGRVNRLGLTKHTLVSRLAA